MLIFSCFPLRSLPEAQSLKLPVEARETPWWGYSPP